MWLEDVLHFGPKPGGREVLITPKSVKVDKVNGSCTLTIGFAEARSIIDSRESLPAPRSDGKPNRLKLWLSVLLRLRVAISSETPRYSRRDNSNLDSEFRQLGTEILCGGCHASES